MTILQYLSNERQTNILQRDIKLKKDFLITFWFKAYTFIDLYTQVYIWNTRKLALTNLNDSTVNGLRFSTSCGEIQYLMVVFHFKLLSNRFSTSIADGVSNFPVNLCHQTISLHGLLFSQKAIIGFITVMIFSKYCNFFKLSFLRETYTWIKNLQSIH